MQNPPFVKHYYLDRILFNSNVTISKTILTVTI